jgi:protein dithiol oxidoreductase (disulfide-forming)
MNRLIKILAVFLTLFSLQQGVFAQTPVKVEEGFDYRVLPIAQSIDAKGKVEVIEFFWYGCPHCYEFEPELKTWLKRQSKDVSFKKVPIAFREELMPHSLLFYALESLGKGDALNDKVMFAMHRENKRLLNENEIADWVAAQGIDRNAFLAAYRSFAVLSKARAANQLGNAYRIDGVPTVAVQGKYITSPSIAGSRAKAINVMDFLVNKVRKEGYK